MIAKNWHRSVHAVEGEGKKTNRRVNEKKKSKMREKAAQQETGWRNQQGIGEGGMKRGGVDLEVFKHEEKRMPDRL